MLTLPAFRALGIARRVGARRCRPARRAIWRRAELPGAIRGLRGCPSFQAANCIVAKRPTTARAAANSGPVTISGAQPKASHMRAGKSGYSLTGPGRLA
jgi:hypothetical protein